MKGAWKDKLSGYNHKSDRRKKQSFKHRLKDNGTWILKNADNVGKETFFEDNVTFSVYNRNSIDPERYPVYTSSLAFMVEQDGKIIFIYSHPEKGILDWFTHKKVSFDVSAPYKELEYLGEVELEVPFNEFFLKERVERADGFTNKRFIYGKLVHKRSVNFDDGKRRKIAQKNAHKRDRRIIRDWINQEDWENEIPTHCTSKSILWEIW